MLKSLLTDKELFGSLDNLDVNPEDPFRRYKAKTPHITCANGAMWYKDAWNHVCTNDKDFMIPIIFACDETTMGSSSACPLLFSTTLLKQSHRNKPNAWRPLGFIFDLDLITSKDQKSRMSTDAKSLRLHKIYEAVLQSFYDAQSGNSLENISLTLGEKDTKDVDIKVPLFYIIGDMQGGDKMCCTSATYRNTLSRPCRKCNVKGSQLMDPLVNCKTFSMEHIKNLILQGKSKELKAPNQHNVFSMFFKLNYGGCKYGIFSACCPIEPLHALENGLFKNMSEVVFKEDLKPVGGARLDVLVQRLNLLPKQRYATSGGGITDFPRLLWKHGVSKLTDLEAKYRVGVLFTIMVVALTEEGRKLFLDIYKTESKVNNIIQCIEMVLCYWKWLKKDKYWKHGSKSGKKAVKTAIQKMLQNICRLMDRKKGQGWALCKFHEQLHVPDDIDRNGPPIGTHTGPVENNHLTMV